jgi:hypothetical protein
MKRMVPWILAIGMMLGGGLNSAFAADPCTRDGLKTVIGQFFTALSTNNTSQLPLTANARYTENGITVPIGEGLWKTAGRVMLKWDLLDTFKCGTHTMAVIEEVYTAPKTAPKKTGAKENPLFASRVPTPPEGTPRPILYGVRLKIEGDRISEIEAIIARETEFAFNAPVVLESKDQVWESIIPVEQRSSRLAMIAAADDYFDMFAEVPAVRTPFAFPCDRWENGTYTTGGGTISGLEVTLKAHDCGPTGLVITNHGPRRFLVDVEAGTVVAYMHFGSSLPDFHMFRMRDGKVDLIQSIIGSASPDMGWPHEPIIRGPSLGSY